MCTVLRDLNFISMILQLLIKFIFLESLYEYSITIWAIIRISLFLQQGHNTTSSFMTYQPSKIMKRFNSNRYYHNMFVSCKGHL